MKRLLYFIVLLLSSFILTACFGGGGGGGATAMYTIGGTVTGLQGNGLVLQNNDTDDLTITSNGSFTFATAIADGTNYNVTVISQPTGQTCTASNTIGTVSGADVANVSVACVMNYTIGGTVTGLYGSGLVLQNNNGDDLAISADGSFTFATPIEDGSNYSVTVFSQPVSPTQTCMLSGASGTVSGSDVTTVTLICSKVSPLYSSNGFNWNDYVQGNDITNATDIACNADIDTSCLHGGEVRVVEVTGYSSCTGITASDALGAFDWSCDESTGTARVISTGFASGYGLADLLDFTTIAWKANSVTIYQNASVIETTTSVNWWSNPVVANTTGGALDTTSTIYVVPNNTSVAYTLTAHNVALVTKPGIVMTQSAPGSSSHIISANGMDYVWIEGMSVNAEGYSGGVEWKNVRFSVMRSLKASNARNIGVVLNASSNNILTGLTANNNVFYGFLLTDSSNNNIISEVSTSSNLRGIYIGTSSNNTLTDISASSSGRYGVKLSESSNNMLTGVTGNNNAFGGVRLEFSSNNTLTEVITSNNGSGVSLHTSSNNAFSSITAINNGNGGVVLYNSSNNTLTNITSSNNSWSGLILDLTSSNNTISELTTSNNSAGISLTDSSDNYFTGKLQVGNNLYKDCNVSGGTNPGLIDTTCGNNGTSDATLTSDVTIASSFVAKVITDDIVNTSDTVGTATITDFSLFFDWANFENPYRAWGRNGSAFPNTTNQDRLGCSDRTYTNQTDCEANSFIWTGDARIWDWSLLTTDAVIKNVLTLPTGNDTLTHTWSDTSTTTILRNAVEIHGDDIGNDNTLCETNETCLYTPNIGSYQGHGNLVNAGSIGTGGVLENIILMKYETNGY